MKNLRQDFNIMKQTNKQRSKQVVKHSEPEFVTYTASVTEVVVEDDVYAPVIRPDTTISLVAVGLFLFFAFILIV